VQGPLINRTGRVVSLLLGERPSLTLRAGEVVRAEVLNVASGNTVSIRLKGMVIEAKTEMPLRKNETLMLRVEGAGREVRLRLVGREGGGSPEALRESVLSALKGLSSARLDAEGLRAAARLLRALPAPVREMLPQLSTIERLIPGIERLASGDPGGFVESSGILFETKLRLLALRLATGGVYGNEARAAEEAFSSMVKGDLKGALLSLQDSLRDEALAGRLLRHNVNPDSLNTAVERLIRNIEFHQLQSRLNDSLQVFIPFIWKELRDGELIIRESYSGKPPARRYSCIVNIDLEGPGRVIAHVLLQAGCFHVSFVTENRAFADLLNEGLPVLERQFEASGLRAGSMSARYEEKVDTGKAVSEGLDVRI